MNKITVNGKNYEWVVSDDNNVTIWDVDGKPMELIHDGVLETHKDGEFKVFTDEEYVMIVIEEIVENG